MDGNRLVDANSGDEIPSSILEFAQQAYSKESPILIADGMPEKTPFPEPASTKPVEPSYGYGNTHSREILPPPQIDRKISVPGYGCQPGIVPPSYYNYQPGSMYCRRQYAPVMPAYGHPRDRVQLYKNPKNTVVRATENACLNLSQYPLWDSYPSEISRQDPSACFLNAVLQKVIGRQSMGNTVAEIGANLDNYSSLTNHFYKHSLPEEVPGDIIIAYPKGGARAEAAIYLGEGRVASYNPENGRVTTSDSITNFYRPKPKNPQDKPEAYFDRVVLYRWASR